MLVGSGALPSFQINPQTITFGGLLNIDYFTFVGQTTGSQVPPEIEAREMVIFIATVRKGLVSQWRIFSDMDRL